MLWGDMEEALDRLNNYITIRPYMDDPELIGYAGMICYKLWKDRNEGFFMFSLG
jgi:hypothetical protein